MRIELTLHLDPVGRITLDGDVPDGVEPFRGADGWVRLRLPDDFARIVSEFRTGTCRYSLDGNIRHYVLAGQMFSVPSVDLSKI